MVFSSGEGYIIALTYGPGADWVRNVLAAGGAELKTRGRTVTTSQPRIYHDEGRHGIRPVERAVLRAGRAADFMALRAET